MDHFQYKGGVLHAEDVPLPAIAAAVATPVYVYSRATLERHARVFQDALKPAGDVEVAFAVKANPNLAVLRALLASAGHSVSCVGGGEAAVAAVASCPDPPFDVVLMDVMMPDLDGREATKRIRALPGAAARVPVLAVTAGAFPEDVAACRDAGMDGHIAKPIERRARKAASHGTSPRPKETKSQPRRGSPQARCEPRRVLRPVTRTRMSLQSTW